MMATNKSKGGRPRDTFADPYVVERVNKDGKLIKICKFCDHEFSINTSITRIKAHLGKVKDQGIAPCRGEVPPNVEEAARKAITSLTSKRSNANILSNSDLQQPSSQECCTLGPPPPPPPQTMPLNVPMQRTNGVQLDPSGMGTSVVRHESPMEMPNLSEGHHQLFMNQMALNTPQANERCSMQLASPHPVQQHQREQDAPWMDSVHDTSIPQDMLTEQWREVPEILPYTLQHSGSCSTHSTSASQHPRQQHPREDHNDLPDQDLPQDAAGLDLVHDATTPQNLLQGGAFFNSLLDSTHQEVMPMAVFGDHEGLSNSDVQQPSPQNTLQQNNVNPTCLDVQSNSLGIGTLCPEDLLQEDTQRPPPQILSSSGPPPLENMLLDGSRQQTNINYFYRDGQSDSFDMGMLEDLESQEIFQYFNADFSSQAESCLTHGTLASPHPMQQHLGEDHNRLSDQDMLQDAARIDSTHNATIFENFLQEGEACPNRLAHSAHLEDVPIAEFENHEGLQSSQHHIHENLQGDQRMSSLDHDPYPSIVPQLYHMHIDPILESMDSPKSSPDQAKHEKKRKFLDQRPIGKTLPLRTIFQGPTFKNKVDKISTSLEDDSSSRIGVYGMGGSGKTTIMKFIHNLLLEGYFMPSSHVIWVTVPQNLTISRLQHHLASLLKVEFSHDEDEVAWAASLYEKMQKLRYALILDDVWDEINLEEVGIPEPSQDNGCKLILTTRSLDVCRRMQCEPIFLDLLSKEEAWDLFVKTLDVDPEKSMIQDIMKEVAKECACLPLAITTIAGSMRGVLNVHEWRDALDSLRNHTRGFTNKKDQVLERLKFSYYRLSEQLQKCLLTCALYPEDTDLKEDLVLMLLMEGTIGSKESLKSTIDHAQTILYKLENACLLTWVSNGFVLHDLIRDMCLDIMGDRFLVKCHSKLPPDLSKYKEVVEKVSLIGSKFEEIPSYMMPYCPKLSTLLLSKNENLTSIPDSFFMSFPKLEFLDLSNTSIQELPSSITNLASLNTLKLDGCTRLRYLPCLAPLKALKLLTLTDSNIKEAPEGLEKLISLTFLDLEGTDIQTVSGLFLTDLVKLKGLSLPDEVKIMTKDLKDKNLEWLRAKFANWEEFSEYVRSVLNSGQGPSFYEIKAELTCVGASCASMLYEIRRGIEEEKITAELRLPKDYEVIGKIPSPEIVHNLYIYRSGSKLPQGEIGENGGLKGLFDAFVNLEDLYVYGLDFTKHLISTSSLVESISSPKVLPCFQNLQKIVIYNCTSFEGMVSIGNPTEKEESNNPIIFPNLCDLTLVDLPNLRSIATLICPSIKSICISQCPKLKRLPLQLQVLDNNNNNNIG